MPPSSKERLPQNVEVLRFSANSDKEYFGAAQVEDDFVAVT